MRQSSLHKQAVSATALLVSALIFVFIAANSKSGKAAHLWQFVAAHSDDPSKATQVAATIRELAELSEPSLLPTLVQTVKSVDDLAVSTMEGRNAAAILAGYKGAEARAALLQLMNPISFDGPIPFSAFVASEAIANQGPNAATIFTIFLQNHTATAAALIVGLRGLGEIHSNSATPILVAYTSDAFSSLVRREAISALAENHDPQVIPALRKLLAADKDRLVRTQTMETLGVLEAITKPR